MNKQLILFTSLATSLLLSGCWDVTEPQRMYYVDGLGIDYKDGQYEVYLQLINFTKVANSENPNSQATQAEVGQSKGKTLEDALFKLFRSIDQKVFWGHMTYIIFSEDAMKDKHAISIIDSLLRYRETRYQIWVYCTQDPIKDILLITPISNKSLTLGKLSNPLNTKDQETFVEPINFRNLVIGLNEPNHEIGIPYITINKNWATADQQRQDTAFTGIGVLSLKGLKGFITNDAARGMQWMQNRTHRGAITFKLEDNETNYLTATLEKIKVDIKPLVKNNQVTFEVVVKLNATLNGFETTLSEDEIKKKIKNEVKKEIKTTYEEALAKDIDIYRLSEQLYRKNMKAWKKLEKDGKIPLTSSSISKLNIYVNQVNSGRKTFTSTLNK
ncbi:MULTISPECIES: Ger(x)C family spore germination protein [unclassified Lysinibacillus]|uniref:Ger(x)C family spore germination protein n=1 Tax=unclassified Lysinibacillus TaxID=2636778 RepID=UPI0020123984|nr:MULTISPECIES: Ger(x)C family spore germination protein [unclassified Lysinibacillus]MCL1696226.1 Ger(x)C family spore germination protein [Lysinibacillus sp. BPa_S21]MCL1700399.1 Ger(x)C family spore germination protein [Lysinibacillus sp. Bpr_S20]